MAEEKILTEWNEEYDPKCPCGAVHPRKHTQFDGLSYIVATDEDRLKQDSRGEPGHISECKYRGALRIQDFEKGLKRSIQSRYSRGGSIWYGDNE
jgi:hypothetical protein